ncbi:MAG: hypothetical protein ACM3JD_19360 [Rudaea sp.]
MTSTYFWAGKTWRCDAFTRANGAADCELFAPAGARGSTITIRVTIGGLGVTTWIYPR